MKILKISIVLIAVIIFAVSFESSVYSQTGSTPAQDLRLTKLNVGYIRDDGDSLFDRGSYVLPLRYAPIDRTQVLSINSLHCLRVFNSQRNVVATGVLITSAPAYAANQTLELESPIVFDRSFIDKGGVVTSVVNEYDSNGNRVLGVMTSLIYDISGNLTSVMMIKERSYYDANGNLTGQSSYKEVDGRIAWIETRSRIYIGSKLFMETKNTLTYGDDGFIMSTTIEKTLFDTNGRETKYSLTRYDGTQKTHTVTRDTIYGDGGSVIHYMYVDTYYNSNGSRSVSYEHSIFDDRTKYSFHINGWQFYMVDGNVIAYYYLDEKKYDDAGRISIERHSYIYQYSFYDENGATRVITANENEEMTTYAYSEDGSVCRTTEMRNECRDGSDTVTSRETQIDSEEYDAAGRIIEKKHFYRAETRPGWGPFQGRLVTTREEEDNIIYEYDSDGDIVNEHNTGYWFTTYVDPWYERLITFVYGLVGDVKKLFKRHEVYTESRDADFNDITRRYEKDEIYTYANIAGKTLMTSATTLIWDERTDGSYLYPSTETRIDEQWLYDESGNTISSSRVESINGEIVHMDIISYAYYANGQLAFKARHTEINYGIFSEDEVLQYNEEGSEIYRSFQDNYGTSYLEQRSYAADGVTLLSKDIVAHNASFCMFDKVILVGQEIDDDTLWENYEDYELHERYDADGKIVYRIETNSRDEWGWFYYGRGVLDPGNTIVSGGPVVTINSSSEEKWDYADNGTLTHYEKKEYTHLYDGICWLLPHSGDDVWSSTTRDYDPATGALLEEEFTAGGWLEFPYAIISAKFKVFEYRPTVPEDGKVLLENIKDYFFNMSTAGDGVEIEKTMTLDYSVSGKVGVKCSETLSDGSVVSSFCGTIEFDANGKITKFTFSYTGRNQEEWQAMLEGLSQEFPRIFMNPNIPVLISDEPLGHELIVNEKVENTPETAINKNTEACEVDAQIATNQAAYEKGKGLAHEMASRQDRYISVLQGPLTDKL